MKKKYVVELTDAEMGTVSWALHFHASKLNEVAGEARAVLIEDSLTRNPIGERIKQQADKVRELMLKFQVG